MLDQSSANRVFLGLRLVAAIRLAFDPRKLAMGALGLCLLQVGWSILDLAVPASTAVTPELFGSRQPTVPQAAEVTRLGDEVTDLTFRLAEPVRLLTTPLRAMLDPTNGWRTMLHALLGLVWLMIVWGPCGGAIARIAVVQEARMRPPGIGEGLRFAWNAAGRLIIAPLCPIFALSFCALVGASFGLLYRFPRVGPVLAGAALFVPLATGLVMTLLVALLVAGWPLMYAAMAAGADDALDALSRTFSYLNQRLGLFAVGIVMAWLAGIVGLFLVDFLAGGVVELTRWSLSFSGPPGLTASLFGQSDLNAGAGAVAAHRFWLGVVQLIAHAWIYSFFWTATALLYLWLRHDVDGTPWTEINLPAVSPPWYEPLQAFLSLTGFLWLMRRRGSAENPPRTPVNPPATANHDPTVKPKSPAGSSSGAPSG
jgi:hypothetical protein